MGGERELISLPSNLLLETKNYSSPECLLPDTISAGRVAAAFLGKVGLIIPSTPLECKFIGGKNPFFRISKCILQRERADRD